MAHHYKTTTGQYFGAYDFEQIDDRLIEITEEEAKRIESEAAHAINFTR